jgi:hypothetical protein
MPPRKKNPRKPANALPIVKAKSTDDWQEWQDLKGEPETIDDGLDALAADEPPRLVSSKLVLGEKDAHKSD